MNNFNRTIYITYRRHAARTRPSLPPIIHAYKIAYSIVVFLRILCPNFCYYKHYPFLPFSCSKCSLSVPLPSPSFLLSSFPLSLPCPLSSPLLSLRSPPPSTLHYPSPLLPIPHSILSSFFTPPIAPFPIVPAILYIIYYIYLSSSPPSLILKLLPLTLIIKAWWADGIVEEGGE